MNARYLPIVILIIPALILSGCAPTEVSCTFGISSGDTTVTDTVILTEDTELMETLKGDNLTELLNLLPHDIPNAPAIIRTHNPHIPWYGYKSNFFGEWPDDVTKLQDRCEYLQSKKYGGNLFIYTDSQLIEIDGQSFTWDAEGRNLEITDEFNDQTYSKLSINQSLLRSAVDDSQVEITPLSTILPKTPIAYLDCQTPATDTYRIDACTILSEWLFDQAQAGWFGESISMKVAYNSQVMSYQWIDGHIDPLEGHFSLSILGGGGSIEGGGGDIEGGTYTKAINHLQIHIFDSSE